LNSPNFPVPAHQAQVSGAYWITGMTMMLFLQTESYHALQGRPGLISLNWAAAFTRKHPNFSPELRNFYNI